MGCDIHSVFQARIDGEWVDVATFWDDERHYQLFAALADVRNGYGFAGVPYAEWIRPISAPRGLPKDFEYYCWEHPTHVEALVPFRRGWWEQDHPLEAKSMDPDTIGVLTGYRYSDDTITLHECAIWMGDHSFSWLMSDEMLNWFNNEANIPRVKIGVLSKPMFEAWDKVSQPQEWFGGIWGKDTVTINECEVGKVSGPWDYVRVTWEKTLKDELSYFFKEVQRLHDTYGKVRFVFGFDS
jgi:hypothetical protein